MDTAYVLGLILVKRPDMRVLSPTHTPPSQVSVAVLLDNFVTASAKIEDGEKRQELEEKRRRQQTRNPLEPLLKKLAKEYVDDADLSDKLRCLYQVT